MSEKTTRIIGWIFAVILSLLFAMSAFMKLTLNAASVEQAASMGFAAETYRAIGIVEIISLILFLVPRTSVIGSLLLVAYMGGAIATHLQHQQPVAMAVAVQVILWITIAVRTPEIRRRLLLQSN